MIVIAVCAVLALAALAAAGWWLWRRRPQPLDHAAFQERWHELQSHLRDKTQWANAIINADKLLETALQRRRISGRTMGERLVKARGIFTDNDSVWFGHKLRSRIDADPSARLKETEVKQALVGIRQALKDVGALPDAKSRDTK